MDISDENVSTVLQILQEDSAFLSSLNLIDYSMLLLKVRKLASGETDEDSGAEALQIDENGVFQLKRIATVRGRTSSVKEVKSLGAIQEGEEKEDSDSEDSLEQDYFEEDEE